MQARKHTIEGSILALKRRTDVTGSPKQGYISGPTKRAYVLQLFSYSVISCVGSDIRFFSLACFRPSIDAHVLQVKVPITVLLDFLWLDCAKLNITFVD